MLDKINGSLILGIAGGVIVIASAIWQWKEKKESDRQAQRAQDSLKTLNQQTLFTAEELAQSYKENAILERSRAEEIIKKTNELSESSKENARLQEELKNQVTGGDTKPTLHLVSYKFTQGDFMCYVLLFDLLNRGKYPLSNIKAVVTDMDGFICAPYVEIKRIGANFQVGKPLKKINGIADWEVSKLFDVGTLTIMNKFPLYAASYSNDPKLWKDVSVGNTNIDEAHYNVEINWSGGFLMFFLTIKISAGKFVLTHYECSFNGKPFEAKNNIIFHAD